MTPFRKRLIAVVNIFLLAGCMLFADTAITSGQSFKPNKTPIRTPFVPAIDNNDFSSGYSFAYVAPSKSNSGFILDEWSNILDHERAQPTFKGEIMNVNKQDIVKQWRKLYQMVQATEFEGNAFEAKLKLVNGFFNQWPYQPDSKNWHKNDYWATPREFILNSGDCEDYAIVKYFALRALRVPAANMAVAIVNDRANNITHAVLVVTNGSDFYTLDNATNLIYHNSTHAEYIPYFFMNEHTVWQP